MKFIWALLIFHLNVIADSVAEFPEWSFCVAYQLRDADKRDERLGYDPFAGAVMPYIPSGGVISLETLDVAALSTRTTAFKHLPESASNMALKNVFEGEGSYPLMDCYMPHHLLVYYDELGVPVICIEICFSCNRVKVFPKTADNRKSLSSHETSDLLGLAKLFYDHDIKINGYKSFGSFSESKLLESKKLKDFSIEDPLPAPIK